MLGIDYRQLSVPPKSGRNLLVFVSVIQTGTALCPSDHTIEVIQNKPHGTYDRFRSVHARYRVLANTRVLLQIKTSAEPRQMISDWFRYGGTAS
jgi:hypothetical protein